MDKSKKKNKSAVAVGDSAADTKKKGAETKAADVKKKGAPGVGDNAADAKKKGAEVKAADVKKKGAPGVGDNAADAKKKEDQKAPSDGPVRRDSKCNAALLASCLKSSEGRASCNTCTPSYNLPKCNALNDDRLKCNQQTIPCSTCTPSYNPPPPRVSFSSDENALSKSNHRSQLSTGTEKECKDDDGSQDSSSCSSEDSHTWTSINDEKNPRYVSLPKPCPSRIEKCPGSRRHSMPSSKLQCHCKSKKRHKESMSMTNTCPMIEYPHNCPCNSKERRASGSAENALKQGSTDIVNSSQNSLNRRKSGSGSNENAFHTCPPKTCAGPRRTCPCKRKLEGPPTGFEYTCPCPRKSLQKPNTATPCENPCSSNRNWNSTSSNERQAPYSRMSHPSMSFERDSPCPRKSKPPNDNDGGALGPCPRKSKVFGIADPCKRKSEAKVCEARPPCCPCRGKKRQSVEEVCPCAAKGREHQEKRKSKGSDGSGRLSLMRRSNSTDYSTSRTNFSDSRAERLKRSRSLELKQERAFVNLKKQKHHSMSKIDAISANGCRKASRVGSFTRLSEPNQKRSGSGCYPRKIKFMYDPPDPIIIHRRRWPPEYCSYCCSNPSPCDSYVACPAYMPCPCNQCPYC